nr:MAG TPA: hypothetical protein [Caudoviricetes sp.]
MERLTEKHYLAEDHYMKCSDTCHGDMDCIDCPAFDQLVERLAAYEDIAELCGGVDRLRELSEADKDGRVIVLPAKKGDTWKKAVSILDKKYAEAKKLPFIRDPLAWALYHTWKEFDDGKRCD